MSRTRFFRILLFFIIATVTCNLFRFETFGFGKVLNEAPFWVKIASVPFQSLGILLGSLLSIYWLRRIRPTINSLFGDSRKWSILMAALPIVLLSIFGIQNTHNINTHLLGLVIGIILMVYCVLEEYGWRGYLEDELSDVNKWVRVIIIAALWYSWHLPFVENHDLISNLKFFGIMLLGSWGIGEVIHATKSVLTAACFHMLYSILILQIKNELSLDTNIKFIIIAICVIVWVVILKVWTKEQKQLVSNMM